MSRAYVTVRFPRSASCRSVPAQESRSRCRTARAGNPVGSTTMWGRDHRDGLWRDENFVRRVSARRAGPWPARNNGRGCARPQGYDSLTCGDGCASGEWGTVSPAGELSAGVEASPLDRPTGRRPRRDRRRWPATGPGLRIVVLDMVMGGCPVVIPQGIQPPSQPACQRLSL